MLLFVRSLETVLQ